MVLLIVKQAAVGIAAYGIYNNSRLHCKMLGGTITTTSNSNNNGYGVYNNNIGTVEITGGNISAIYSVYNKEKGNIKILDGNMISSRDTIYNYSTGTIEVTGGVFRTTGGSCAGIYNNQTGEIVIGEKDRIVHNDTIQIISEKWYGVYQKTIKGFDYYDGTIIGKNMAICGVINETEEGNNIILEDTDEIEDGEKTTIGEQNEVAYVEPDNTVLYDDLQDAINACGEEGTVVLVKDITSVESQKKLISENSDITVNLNGHSIRTFGCAMENYGTLDLIDIVEESTGKILGCAESMILNENTGILTNENVTIENVLQVTTIKGIYNKGNLCIKGGKIVVNYSNSYAIYNEGVPSKEVSETEVIGELVSEGDYYFTKDENGQYVCNNNIRSNTATSYLKIDLTDKEGCYYLKTKATIQSANSSDNGYVTLKDNDNLNKELIRLYGGSTSKTGENTYILMGGKEYYLYFSYYRWSSSGVGEFTINSIKIFKNEAVVNIEDGEITGYYGIYNINAFVNKTGGKIGFTYCGIYENSNMLAEANTINVIGGTIEYNSSSASGSCIRNI